MANTATATSGGGSAAKKETNTDPIVIDMGKHSKRKIKKLRKGRGGLMEDVLNSIEELSDSNDVAAGVPVIVVVAQKSRKGKYKYGKFPF